MLSKKSFVTKKLSIRELGRNVRTINGYDYVEIEDRKSKEYKGIFVSPKYAQEVKRFLEEKIRGEKHELLDELERFAGKFTMEERYEGLEDEELLKKISRIKTGTFRSKVTS